MMKGSDGILEQVLSLAEPLAKNMGFEVLRLEVGTEHGKRTLRIFLDKHDGETGVTVEDCATFSRALDPILEVEANLEGRYDLEVSSPGLNRPLVRPEHFEAQVGKVVELATDHPIDGRQRFKGELKEVLSKNGQVFLVLSIDRQEFNIPMDAVKKAHLDYFATEAARKRVMAKQKNEKK
jgi:ribosome maturation factor RimP